MNPADLARKIEAVIVDYDYSTAMTALDIAKLLVSHRKMVELDFNQASLSSERSDSDTP